jgi:hypothetical protein
MPSKETDQQLWTLPLLFTVIWQLGLFVMIENSILLLSLVDAPKVLL